MDSSYKTRVNTRKEDAVEKLRAEFEAYDGYIFTDYRGLTVEQITALRKDLRKDDAAYRVIKNRYAKIAFEKLSDDVREDQLKGPTAVALVKGDTANTVAASILASQKAGTTVSLKGALIGGKFMSKEEIEALSKLPSRLELIASFMGTMKAPVQKLAATLLAYLESKGGAVSADAN